MSTEKLYAAMRQSGMNDWVGGGDPAGIGGHNFASIIENLALQPNHAILDFGCGIGRTAAPVAEFLSEGGRLVGSDIVPRQIAFCQEQFAPLFPNAMFYCVQASNPLYNQFVDGASGTTLTVQEKPFFLVYREAFDLVAAFSVFTHFDPTMAAHYLESLSDLIKPSGTLFLTWFLDHPGNAPEARLGADETFRDLHGNLELALYSPAAVVEAAAAAGLLVERISYGFWRGWAPHGVKGQHSQDIVILRRRLDRPSPPIEFDASRYLALHKDVAEAGANPEQHYLYHGHKEGRRLK
jgi:SAM-dependent methyltransferase